MASLMHGEGGQVGMLVGYWQWDVSAANAYRDELLYDQAILIAGQGDQLCEELKETASDEALDGMRSDKWPKNDSQRIELAI